MREYCEKIAVCRGNRGYLRIIITYPPRGGGCNTLCARFSRLPSLSAFACFLAAISIFAAFSVGYAVFAVGWVWGARWVSARRRGRGAARGPPRMCVPQIVPHARQRPSDASAATPMQSRPPSSSRAPAPLHVRLARRGGVWGLGTSFPTAFLGRRPHSPAAGCVVDVKRCKVRLQCVV